MRWTFSICNPSPYARTDYVRLDLRQFPESAAFSPDELLLKRVWSENTAEPVPFQIDAPLGPTSAERELVFLARGIARNDSAQDTYDRVSANYELTGKRRSQPSVIGAVPPPYHEPGLAFLYTSQQPRSMGENPVWDPPDHLELRNRGFRVRIRVSDGAAISACLNYRMFTAGFGEVLQFDVEPSRFPGAFWAGIGDVHTFASYGTTPLALTPTPVFSVVSAHSGPCRATVTLRSQRLTFEEAGRQQGTYLYRVLSVYGTMDAPDLRTFFGDDLWLVREGAGSNLLFSPTLRGQLVPPTVRTQLFHSDHVSDYFSVWKRFGVDHRGFCVAADSHIKRPTIDDSSVLWSLSPSALHKCLNYFAYHTDSGEPFDPTHVIGRFGWYERLFRPISLCTSIPVRKE